MESTASQRAGRNGTRSRGQVLVIFAGALFLLMMMAAIVIDVSWYWVNSLRVQRAADAAALAGAVMLPNEPSTAYTLARDEARRNGYIAGATPGGNVVITPLQDGGNPRRLNVTISAPIGTFFMKVIGIPFINVTRSSKAEFTLPVPMGSPQNYYGVGLLNLPTPGSTGWRAGANINTDWTTPVNADSTPNTAYAVSPTSGSLNNANEDQDWTSFVPGSGVGSIPNSSAIVIDGIQVRLRAHQTGTGNNTSTCRLQVELSGNNGGSWSNPKELTTPITTTPLPVNTYQQLGSTSDGWGDTWSRNEVATNNFRVRLTYIRGSTFGCSSTRSVSVDTLEVLVSYHGDPAPTNVVSPDGNVLAPQFFWGAMQSQGAPSVQGDSYMTGYQTRKSAANAKYDPVQYYNYGIDMPAGGGQVWIFDPGFCDTAKSSTGINQGTGENWTVGGSNGNATVQPVSAQYNLYRDDPNTPYQYGDDTLVGSSLNTFRRLSLYDPTLSGNSDANGSCVGLSWHNGWWSTGTFQNLPAGRYRLHTTSRIFVNGNSKVIGNVDGSDDQRDTTALNAFAIWTKTTGTVAPRVYGLGAMEAYFPLSPNTSSTFYLAQIEAVHAGKWMDIDLWDPGDTGALSADLQIRMPASGGYTNAQFYYNSATGTTLPANFTCGPGTSGLVNHIVTNTGNNSLFQGKWLRICVKLDDNYAAPTPPGEAEPGWWKITYNMGGNTGDTSSTDLTTWQVSIRGNPVHLVLP